MTAITTAVSESPAAAIRSLVSPIRQCGGDSGGCDAERDGRYQYDAAKDEPANWT
jgi:hypothetical protein